VFRIRIGFKADPNIGFYLNADPESQISIRIHADFVPDPNLAVTLKDKREQNLLAACNGYKNYIGLSTKPFFKR
jgi:hypothetical protein